VPAVKRLSHKHSGVLAWLYPRAWAEDIHEIEMAVPMSPDQVTKKLAGIFKHQSQKDGVVHFRAPIRGSSGSGAEEHRATAALTTASVLAEYEAMEAFRALERVILECNIIGQGFELRLFTTR